MIVPFSGRDLFATVIDTYKKRRVDIQIVINPTKKKEFTAQRVVGG